MLQQTSPLQHGQSLTKKHYLQLLGDLPTAHWKCLMYGNQTRLKACFTVCLCLQQRLLSTDRLIRWGVEANPTCVLQGPESHEHLFVHCPVAQSLRSRLLRWIHRLDCLATNQDDFVQWNVKHAKGKSHPSQLFKMVLPNVLMPYEFENKRKMLDSMAKDPAYMCTVRAPTGLQAFVHILQF